MIFKSEFFSKNIEPACEYCLHGERSKDGRTVLCMKKGVVAPYYSCSKYKYEITKRVPKQQVKLHSYDDEDFSL